MDDTLAEGNVYRDQAAVVRSARNNLGDRLEQFLTAAFDEREGWIAMKVLIPAYIEVERGVFKSTLECNYAEFVSGLMRESDSYREGLLNEVLGLNLRTWRSLPLVTLADMADE